MQTCTNESALTKSIKEEIQTFMKDIEILELSKNIYISNKEEISRKMRLNEEEIKLKYGRIEQLEKLLEKSMQNDQVN